MPDITLTAYLAKHGNTVNGKKLRQPDLNLVAKLDAMGVTVPEHAETVYTENPVSGHSAMLNPFLAMLVQWTFRVYATYDFDTGGMNYKGTKVAISTYDRVKGLILSLDGSVYSNFID